MVARKPRLGIYCPGTGTGGPWRYVHSILAGLDPGEFAVTVFCDLPGLYEPQPWVEVVRLGGPISLPGGAPVAANIAPATRSRSLLRQFVPPVIRLWGGFGRQALQLARLLRQYPVDLFHTQNTGCEESPVAAKLAAIPHVVGTFHVDSTYDLHHDRSGPGHRGLEVLSNHCLDKAIAVSQATKRDWVRRTHVPASRVIRIHNGIDPQTFRRRQSREVARKALGLPADALIVGVLGRLDEAKGFTYLLEAAARLASTLPNLFVTIAGTGMLREKLESQAARLGIANRVRFLGFQPDVQLTLDSLDVFALPSLCETLGYALLEAMATELPAIGSAVGGVPEVIVPGETGLLVRSRQADELATALRTLLRDAELRQRMGVAGRERVVRYFQEREMVRKTIELYRDVLGT